MLVRNFTGVPAAAMEFSVAESFGCHLSVSQLANRAMWPEWGNRYFQQPMEEAGGRISTDRRA